MKIGNISNNNKSNVREIKEPVSNTKLGGSIYSANSSKVSAQQNDSLLHELDIVSLVNSLYDDEHRTFNFETFAKYEPNTQKEILRYLMAQNKFLFEDKKTIEEWNKLQDKSSYIANIDIDAINPNPMTYENTLLTLVAVNRVGDDGLPIANENFDLSNIGSAQWYGLVSDYLIANYDEDNKSLLSVRLEKMAETRRQQSDIIKILLRDNNEFKKIDKNHELYETFLELRKPDNGSILDAKEVKQALEALGKSHLDIDIIVHEQELKTLTAGSKEYKDKEKLINQLKSYNDLIKYNKKSKIEIDDSIKNNVDRILNDYTIASEEDKKKVLFDYINKLELKDKIAVTFYIREKTEHIEQAFYLYQHVYSSATPEQQEKLLALEELIAENAVNHDNIKDSKHAEILQKTFKNNNATEAAGYVARNGDSDIHDYSGYGEDSVEKAYGDNVLGLDDVEKQARGLDRIHKNSGCDARIHVGTNLDKAKSENQNPYLKKFAEDKEIAKAINENKTITRFRNENQVDAYQIMQLRFEQPDYTPEESLEQLNALVDQIQYFNKDNHEALYNLAMNSSNQDAMNYAKKSYENYVSTIASDSGNDNAKGHLSTTETSTLSTQNTSYQTNPITSSINETPFITTEPAKSVYQQLISGDVSAVKIAESFNELSTDEKVSILKTLKPSDVAKMPISICSLCPEFIPQFVSAGKGIDIIKTVPDVASSTIRYMKKSSDNDVKNQLYAFMIEYPAQFMKISVQEAEQKLGIAKNHNLKSLHYRA